MLGKHMKIILPMLVLCFMNGISGCVSTPVEQKSVTQPAPPLKARVQKQNVENGVSAVPKAEPMSNIANGVQSEKEAYQLPSELFNKYTSVDGLRLDLAAVTQALYLKLLNQSANGKNGEGPVVFAQEIDDFNDGTEFSYEGFALRTISVRKDEQVNANPLHRRMEATLMLQDVWGRQAFVATAADYLIGDNNILVRQAVVLPHYPEQSTIRFLVIPSSRMVSLQTLKHLPLTELYRLSAENSLTHEELTNLPSNVQGKYNLVVFNMVRSKPNDVLKLYISGGENGSNYQSNDRLILNRNGWSTTVVAGIFEFNSSSAYRFHVALDRNGKLHEVGRFSSSFQN